MTDQAHIARAFDRDLGAIQAQMMKLGGNVAVAMSDATEALESRGPEMVERVPANDRQIDAPEDPRDITTSMHPHFIAKNIERLGDQVTSIAEQVIHPVTGKYPDEAGPIGDNTSFDDAPAGRRGG